MDEVAAALCQKDIALLGEASHGDGETIQFKVELVRRLITKCHYNAFFIESGVYDFIALNRRLLAGEPVGTESLASAIGRIWSSSSEFTPLLSFLLDEAREGRLVLGGIDDQISSTAKYAQSKLPIELAKYLSPPRGPDCLAELGRYVRYEYSQDTPYSQSDQARVLACLREIRTVIGNTGPVNTLSQKEHMAMVTRG